MNNNTENNEAEIVDLAEEAADRDNSPESGEQDAPREEQSEANQPRPAQQFDGQAELMTKLMRLQADFDNYRRRANVARAESRAEAKRELLLDLLPIYDNFLRAMGHAEEVEDYGSLRGGIQGIIQQMRDFFNRQNLMEIDSQPGTEFDPNRHDAVGTMKGDADNNNTVGQEVLKGFELNGNVIRPAQVLVFYGE